MKTLIVLLVALLPFPVLAQLETQQIVVPPQFLAQMEPGNSVRINSQYKIDLFYIDQANVKRPRFMAVGRNGVLYVADLGSRQIHAITDFDKNGYGDTAYNATAFQVDSVHSIYIWNDTMFAAEPSRIRKFIDGNQDGYFESESVYITGIHSTGPYNHYTRTVLVDTIRRNVYVSIGASCNACREENFQRGTIQQYALSGFINRTFASGLRNAIGLALDEDTLWATNADRDGLGDNLPPEIITKVADNSFHGWPFAYGSKVWVDFSAGPEYQALLPITKNDSMRVDRMHVPEITLEAHSTPMGIIFYRDPRTYVQSPPKTMLVARHGSSKGGRSVAVGYDVLRFQQDKVTSAWIRDTFITGFLTDSVEYTYWGRPCGLTQDSLGAFIYLSSDVGLPAIYRISLKDFSTVKTAGFADVPVVYPNPARDHFSIGTTDAVSVQLFSVLGNELPVSFEQTQSGVSVRTTAPPGSYLCKVTTKNRTVYSLPIVIW